MSLNAARYLLRRAVGGMRRRPWLHALSVLTLAAAFLSFGATLTAAFNLDGFIDRWVGTAEMTVYLANGRGPDDLERLGRAVGAVDGVARVERVTPAAARERFCEDLGAFGDMARSLPEEAFPASIDIHLGQTLVRDHAAREALARRLSQVELVGHVEVYDDWFDRLRAVSLVGRLAAWGLGLLAFVVAILVIAATVRAGVAARRKEIEVLRLMGATDGYVRLPFLIQGGLEAAAGMGLAVVALRLIMGRVDLLARDLLPLIGGGSLRTLTAGATAALFVGGVLAGIAGARLSLRRLEEV